MSRTVTRLFLTFGEAKVAVAELERIGVPHSEISIISGDSNGRHLAGQEEHLGDHDPILEKDAGKGATVGASMGAGAGVLAGLALLTIPGLGPVAAVGWLAATIAASTGGAALGTAAGGLVATLTHHGVAEADAHRLSEGVRRGETLVSARVSDEIYAEAERALQRLSSTDALAAGRPEPRSAGLP
jgi:hypothetical protein